MRTGTLDFLCPQPTFFSLYHAAGPVGGPDFRSHSTCRTGGGVGCISMLLGFLANSGLLTSLLAI